MQSKRWTFTLNNPTATETSDYVHTQCQEGKSYKYLVFQLEQGDNGTPHYQGFVIFDGARRLTAVKRMLERAHWEPARGSSPQNRHYCTKPIADCACTHCTSDPMRLQGPWTFGECPEGAGDRTDIKRLRDLIISGKRKRHIIEDDEVVGTYAKHMKFAHEVQSLYPPERQGVPEITLLYGPADCGKTRHFFDTEDDRKERWIKPVDDKLWFDGYDGHESVLFDDFAGRFNKFQLNNLLRITDRYDATAPVKGGYVPFYPKRFYITTNIHPYEWYDWSERQAQYPALFRRFTRVIAWRADGAVSRQFDRGSEDFQQFFTSYTRRGQTAHLVGGTFSVAPSAESKFDFCH